MKRVVGSHLKLSSSHSRACCNFACRMRGTAISMDIATESEPENVMDLQQCDTEALEDLEYHFGLFLVLQDGATIICGVCISHLSAEAMYVGDTM